MVPASSTELFGHYQKLDEELSRLCKAAKYLKPVASVVLMLSAGMKVVFVTCLN